jgi:membrane-bound lytic murein transglycosylase
MKKNTFALCLIASVQAFTPTSAKDVAYQPVSNFPGNGFELYQLCKDLFSLQAMPVKKMPLSNDFKMALAQQQAWLLEIKRQHKLSKAQQAVLELPNAEQKNELDLTQFDAWLSPGEHCGNTLLIGYVSPELRLKRNADTTYKFPVYKLPKAELQKLSRDEISQRQSEFLPYIAGYSDSELDIFLLQVQGSGLVEFIDTGEKLTLGWAANNSHPYQSLGKHLVKTGKIPVEYISVESIRAYFAKHPSEVSDTLRVN